METRDLISSQSTSSIGSETFLPPSCGSCMELLRDLYQELEPQISKSYRPNVKYIPRDEPPPRHITMATHERIMQDKAKKHKQMKTAKIVIDAVSELQKRRDSTGLKKKFSDIARRASAEGQDDKLIKGVSQSLPDLTEDDSS